MKRFHVMVFTILMLLSTTLSSVFGQNSQQISINYKSLSPDYDHYAKLALLSNRGQDAQLDTIRFPIKDFRRMAYLKLRTVYLNLPVSYFKIRQFPANSSEQTQAELKFLLDLQAQRTPDILALTDTMAEVYHDPFTNNPTNEDYARNINSLFYIGRNLGTWYNVQNLPFTSQVLQNVIQDATYYFFSLKGLYARPRPYQLSQDIKNPEAPGHSSYPSGHSSASYVNAFLLAEVFPKQRQVFLGNAYDRAFSREIRRVHYPSDSQMGKDFAQKFIQALLKNPKFAADFVKMKVELKKVQDAH